MTSPHGLVNIGMSVDAEHTHAHTAIEMVPSGIDSDDVDMDDPEAVADDISAKNLERIGYILSILIDKDTPDFKKAVTIHRTFLENSKGFQYAMQFSRYHPYSELPRSFASAILDSYSKKDYLAILNWRPPQSPNLSSSNPQNVSFPRNTQSGANRDIMARQYSVPYIGGVAQSFGKFIQTLATQDHHENGKQQHYANVIPVIQSSGTGKSRMLTETGKTLFTLPFCAREKGGAGWPPGDNKIVACLLESEDDQFNIKTHIIFIAFLAAIFTEMKHVLEEFGTSDIDTLRRIWHTNMEPGSTGSLLTREHFYANVLNGTKKNEAKIGSRNSELDPLPQFSEDYSEHANDAEADRFFNLLITCVDDLSREFLKPEVIALLNVIPKQILLIYMDEANTFRSRYWALQRVLWTLKEHGMLWFSFMGTNASLSAFVPAAVDLKSARLADESLVLLHPYTALGFDQNIINLSPRQAVTMGQVRSLERICHYGRPLWKAMWEARHAGSAVGVVNETMFFQDAKMKLLCSTKGFDWEKTEQVFAILAYTVCLDLVVGNPKATKFANTSVANHMRLLINVTDDRTVYFTQASSEPVLALVGAYIAAKPNHLLQIIDKLTNNICKDGLVDKGRHGELLARMILFIARIQSCSSPSTPLSFATPIPVVHFLKTLFGELWDKTTGHERFEKGLEGGYVNFYHFTLTRDEMPVKEDLNFEANLWTRGTALQCNFRQVAIDGHISVYWGSIDDHKPLDPSKFSSLDYQVKLKNAGDTVLADRIQRRASARRSAKYSSYPFIAVFLDMGSVHEYTSTKSRLWLETGDETLERLKVLDMTKLPQQQQNTAKKAIEALKLDSNRYCINARGCDMHVFDVLKTMDIANKWKKLVEMTVEAPDIEREIVKTMQPLYHLDLDSGYCDWMKDYSASHNQT